MNDLEKLLAAAKEVDHAHPYHPQKGNPLYPWWREAKFKCSLCLAVMEAEGTLVDEFCAALPFVIPRFNVELIAAGGHESADFEAWFWKEAWLEVVPRISDDFDRRWTREQLARALARGRERAEEKAAS